MKEEKFGKTMEKDLQLSSKRFKQTVKTTEEVEAGLCPRCFSEESKDIV